MNLNNLQDNKSKLLNFMKDNGYSGDAVYSTKTTIDFILSNNSSEWNDYDDVRKSILSFYSGTNVQARRITALNRIIMFDLYEIYPGWRRYPELDKISCYYSLHDYYRKLVDEYRESLSRSSLAESTVYHRTNAAASLLLKIQSQGISNLNELCENTLIELFWNNGNPFEKTLSDEFKDFLKRIRSVDEDVRRKIIGYIPKKKKCVNNKQYLTKTEVEAVRKVLRDETKLSLRDRTIGSLLFYSGLRGVDICNLRITDIDWNMDEINIVQGKTGVPLKLPLDPVYGNLIFDYLNNERPESESEFLFISSRKPHNKLTRSAISSRIVNNIFDAAEERLEKGQRRGSHIFRHNFVSMMLDHQMNNVLISSLLGHTSVESIQPYLNTDFSHLKECALSIENFPYNSEALQ